MSNIVGTLSGYVGTGLARLIVALLILIVGWLLARIISGAVAKLLQRIGIDRRLAQVTAGSGTTVSLAKIISQVVFWLIMLIVLVAFFQVLNLTAVTDLLNGFLNQITQYLPLVLAAGVLVVIAWIVATLLRLIVSRGLHAAGVDQRVSAGAGMAEGQVPLSKTIGEAVYWLVWLFFLPAILGALKLSSLLAPVQNLLDKLLSYLPNILAAAVILLIGWFVARIVRRIVTSLLAAAGADGLSERMGLAQMFGKQKLSGVIGLIVYVVILIPVLVAALNALKIDALTAPVSNMLAVMLAALPKIFAAVIVLAIAYFVGRLIGKLVSSLLAGVGFDNIMARLGLGKAPAEGQRTPSEIVGYLVLVAIMVFAVQAAAGLLGWASLTALLAEFLVFAGHILMGVIIFAIGLWLASLVGGIIMDTAMGQKRLVAMVARVAILVLATAMALRQMGLANEIITLGFGLLLGAVAVAAAIAFGIGGRDLAKYQLVRWYNSVNENAAAGIADHEEEEVQQ